MISDKGIRISWLQIISIWTVMGVLNQFGGISWTPKQLGSLLSSPLCNLYSFNYVPPFHVPYPNMTIVPDENETIPRSLSAIYWRVKSIKCWHWVELCSLDLVYWMSTNTTGPILPWLLHLLFRWVYENIIFVIIILHEHRRWPLWRPKVCWPSLRWRHATGKGCYWFSKEEDPAVFRYINRL